MSSKERSESSDNQLADQHYAPELNKYFTDNVYLTELWHFNEFFSAPDEDNVKSTWRSKERMKTTGVALVLCLNIGILQPLNYYNITIYLHKITLIYLFIIYRH